ncbi:MAG: hypothetical protein HY336_01135 [Candidatus Doudnabacteria bacterium]|nr:hypothetical protein [Candidatus Doudnabacteria bacterium]
MRLPFFQINKWLILFFLVSVLIVLQTGFSTIPLLSGFNLALIYSVISVIHSGRKESAFVVIFSGILLDFYSGLVDGTLTLSLILTAVAVYFLANSVLAPASPRLINYIAVFFGILCFNVLVLLLSLALSVLDLASLSTVWSKVLRKIFPELIFALILTQPMFWLFQIKNRVFKILAP